MESVVSTTSILKNVSEILGMVQKIGPDKTNDLFLEQQEKWWKLTEAIQSRKNFWWYSGIVILVVVCVILIYYLIVGNQTATTFVGGIGIIGVIFWAVFGYYFVNRLKGKSLEDFTEDTTIYNDFWEFWRFRSKQADRRNAARASKLLESGNKYYGTRKNPTSFEEESTTETTFDEESLTEQPSLRRV
jgi:hypothetical protein